MRYLPLRHGAVWGSSGVTRVFNSNTNLNGEQYSAQTIHISSGVVVSAHGVIVVVKHLHVDGVLRTGIPGYGQNSTGPDRPFSVAVGGVSPITGGGIGLNRMSGAGGDGIPGTSGVAGGGGSSLYGGNGGAGGTGGAGGVASGILNEEQMLETVFGARPTEKGVGGGGGGGGGGGSSDSGGAGGGVLLIRARRITGTGQILAPGNDGVGSGGGGGGGLILIVCEQIEKSVTVAAPGGSRGNSGSPGSPGKPGKIWIRRV